VAVDPYSASGTTLDWFCSHDYLAPG
jgi:hypothetical protein